LSAALGPRIGRVLTCGPRRRVPLLQTLRNELAAHRVVVLGNAAQTLHPVAGQGLNLGLRDCRELADLLGRREPGAALAEYAARRQLDRQAIGAITQWLPPLFATRFAPLAAARSAALALLGVTPFARRQLAHLLMFGVRP
jgi:2-octaprenyl-6-methoxyphenol hydroxylase